MSIASLFKSVFSSSSDGVETPPGITVGDNQSNVPPVRMKGWNMPDPMDHLSRHFRFREMIHSNTANRLGIDNTPGKIQIVRFEDLCMNVLEPIRQHFGSPITITSGYRSLELNRAIGSHDNSQHVKGEAADFKINGYSLSDAFEWIVVESDIDFDQIIYEFGEQGWIHISHTNRRDNRNQALCAYKNSRNNTRYEQLTVRQVKTRAYQKNYR